MTKRLKIKRANFKENKSWELEMPDHSSIHRIEVYVGKRHIDYFYVPKEYVKDIISGMKDKKLKGTKVNIERAKKTKK